MPDTPRPLVAQAADADELRDLLDAVLDAIDLPYAATVGGDEVRARILADRIVPTVVVLRAVLAPDRPQWESVPSQTEYLRGELEKHPATGYVTDLTARKRREAGHDYMASVTPQTTEEGAR